MDIGEILAALAAGLIAGAILAFAEKQWPESGIARI